MRLLMQRVLRASVTVAGKEISSIGPGLLVFLGISTKDSADAIDRMVSKILKLRLWSSKAAIEPPKPAEGDEESKSPPEKRQPWKTNVVDNEYEVLVVSQFTLYAVVNNGNKPDFHQSMNGGEAIKIYDEFLNRLQKEYVPERIKGGSFGAMMDVGLINDGPVTIWIDSEKDGGSGPEEGSEKAPKGKKGGEKVGEKGGDKAQQPKGEKPKGEKVEKKEKGGEKKANPEKAETTAKQDKIEQQPEKEKPQKTEGKDE